MIKDPGISNTEVRDNLEWFSDKSALCPMRVGADVPYELLIVYTGHDEYKWDMGKRGDRKVKGKEQERIASTGGGLVQCTVGLFTIAFYTFNPN